MNITVSGQHFEVTPELRAYAIEKIEKLEKHVKNIIKAHVVLKIEHTRDEKHHYVAHADIHLKGHDFYAKEEADNMYAAIDVLSDKLVHQAQKIKDRE